MSFFVNMVCFVIIGSISSTRINEQLYNDLFRNYVRYQRPLRFNESTDQFEPTVVLVQPSLYGIIDLNEARETITVAQWYTLVWQDNRLKWDPDAYQGLTTILVPDHLIWLPDVKMFQILDSEKSEILPFYAKISSDGNVHFSENLVVTAHCPLDVSDFPYDVQACNLTYIAWLHTSEEIELRSMTGTEGDLSVFKPGSEWTLLDYSVFEVEKHYSSGSYFELHFRITIRRQPSYYILTLTFPSFLIVGIALLGLFSPFQATQERQEKVTIGLTALLTIAVILMMVAELMPKNSIDFPFLGDYILLEMILISVATLSAVFIMYWHSQAKFGRSVPFLLGLITLKLKSKRKVADVGGEAHTVVGPEDVWNGGDTSDSVLNDLRLQSEESLKTLKGISNAVKSFAEKLASETKQEALMDEWMQICFRLDMICLTIYMSIQIALTAVYSRIFG